MNLSVTKYVQLVKKNDRLPIYAEGSVPHYKEQYCTYLSIHKDAHLAGEKDGFLSIRK